METQLSLADLAEDWGVTAEALSDYASDQHLDVDGVINYKDHFFDSYVGWYPDGLLNLAEEIVEMNVGDDNWLVVNNYIDYEQLVYDLSCEGYWVSDNGNVFRPA